MESGLKLYSLGIVLAAKIRGKDTIIVDPIEHLSMSHGELDEGSTSVKVESVDRQGVSRASQVEQTSSIEAKWLPLGNSNRELAPDVQNGETVLLFKYQDTDEFYWTTIFREPMLRRLETVRHSYSNQPSGRTPYGDDTSYWVEVSTHDKQIRLHTSTNDGEAAGYDLTFDTGSGTLTIQDDMDNVVVLNSVLGELTADIREKVVINTKVVEINASESMQVTTPVFDVKTSSLFQLSAPGAVLGGGQAGGAAGRSLFEGGLETQGSIDVEGDITASGRIIDVGGNTPNHSH